MRQAVAAFTLFILVIAHGALACTGVVIAGEGHVVIGTASHWRRGIPIVENIRPLPSDSSPDWTAITEPRTRYTRGLHSERGGRRREDRDHHLRSVPFLRRR